MNIAVVHWFIYDVGGINSWTENIVDGLRALGHTVQIYYGSHQRKLGCLPDRKVIRSRRWHLLPARLLSYHENDLKSSLKVLNSYDRILFAHPSPHPTKINLQCSNPKGWQSFYNETSPSKCFVFHDRHWDRTNKWIEDVKDCVQFVFAAQHHFIPSVKRFCDGSRVPYSWGVFPLRIYSPLAIEKKRRRFVVPTQWLAIKNHRFLIPNLAALAIPVHSYGSGQTYHKLLPVMTKVYREDHHQDKVSLYNPRSKHVHYGHVEYSLMLEAVREAYFSLDMSIQGMTNMTHWEPLAVGTASVLERRVLEDRFCEIPGDCCLTFSLDNLVDDLNRIAKLPSREVLKTSVTGYKFVQQCKPIRVAKFLLDEWTAVL